MMLRGIVRMWVGEGGSLGPRIVVTVRTITQSDDCAVTLLHRIICHRAILLAIPKYTTVILFSSKNLVYL